MTVTLLRAIRGSSAYAVGAPRLAARLWRDDCMSVSWPVAALTILGIILVILGLLVGGLQLSGVQLIGLGLAALVVAGYFEVARQRKP
jgi:hypothetical protein